MTSKESTPSLSGISRRGFVKVGAAGMGAVLGTGCSEPASGTQAYQLERPGLGSAPQSLFAAAPINDVGGS